MRVDLHTHFYPPEYWQRLAEWCDGFETVKDAFGRTIVKKNGARFVTPTPPMSEPELRIKEMDAAGIDIQAISLSAPNVYYTRDDEKGLELARFTNNKLAEVRDKYPKRFMCLASVPLQNVEMAIEELNRAINQLGMNGAIIGSNINGKQLNSPEFEPFWAECNKLKLAITMHPMPPIGMEKMGEFGLAPMVGFIFDCNLAIARMVYDGIFERYPDFKMVLPHLGGAVSILIERWDHGFREMPDCRVKISKPPSEYIKNLYFDTVNFHKPAMMCCYGTVGAGQMVLGSDYPHIIGDIYRSVTSIQDMDISGEEKEMIFGGNALRILKTN
ncbi:MAG: amidohydrolase [Chloroflexi bacterium]|nr:amidohydrolase [Chloroflexota bacterium]